MLIVLATGVALWVIYGLGTGQLPVILANVVTFLLVMVLLILKLRDVLCPSPVGSSSPDVAQKPHL